MGVCCWVDDSTAKVGYRLCEGWDAVWLSTRIRTWMGCVCVCCGIRTDSGA